MILMKLIGLLTALAPFYIGRPYGSVAICGEPKIPEKLKPIK